MYQNLIKHSKVVCLGLLFFTNFHAAKAQNHLGKGNLQYVDPRIGNVGQLLVPTRPTVQQPNQVIRMYPLRQDYLDDRIKAYPLTIVSHRLGEAFSIKPVSGEVSAASWKKALPYDHDLEITRPWYYEAWLVDEEITVRFTPGKKAGIFEFEFDKTGDAYLLFQLLNGKKGSYSFQNDSVLTGMEIYHDDIPIYLYGVFNRQVIAGTLQNNQVKMLNHGESANKLVVKLMAAQPRQLSFKYAISFISAEQAKQNFEEELHEKNFKNLYTEAENAWDNVINQIEVSGGTVAQKRSFYTALYRCYERMVDITEDGRYYSGYDKKVHNSEGRPFYVDDWTWDTYLAHHPLRTLLHPGQEEDMLQSFVKMYEQSGWMPTFPVLFGDHACMNGFHSTVMFLDGYRKGLRNFDREKAFEGMLKNAEEATMLPWRNGPKTGLTDFYHQNGYFPALHPGEKESNPLVHPFEKRQAVAVTLGHSYDDWALASFAQEIGRQDTYKKYIRRAQNYKTLWKADQQLFMPKDEKGQWINIDPKFDGGMGGRDYYDENNGWTYLWQVQQDIPGLVELLGGKNGFEAKLDQLFREGLGRSKYEFWSKFPDATGLVGQYSMGNEPSFHIPYLYNFTNAPWKTQQHIRFLLDTWFKDNIFGIPGDEDGGGMTAFVVFSSLGFYPISPGMPIYTLGSPLFESSTIRLENGKQFKVIAHHASKVNKYIQSAKLNGKELKTPFINHQQVMSGAVLELEMGPKPNKDWGITN